MLLISHSIAGRSQYPVPKAQTGQPMNMHANFGQLSVALKAKMPTANELFSIVKQVEDEMAGKPLNAETAYTFVEEVKKRVADLIVIEID
ncbi:hypothetical protein [Raoultella planticola]|uniref:hypothetical protein n=2 Tax=Raoultella planticola TaxID=575 RepID=UPI001F53526F|nr:hypothetical protein [Raoultella planticola]UNK75144.1 hypothetical protein MNO12_00635 [Raoultella planticola]